MVNQIISAIPQPGKRGIDARTTFVTKQEAFQDHLYDNTVDELNTFAGEVNNTTTAVNTTLNSSIIVRDQTTQKASEASSSATLASQKASEASTSANQALTYKNQLQGYVVPAGASYSVEQINTQNSAMTKAQFNALAEERKANRAGSGFDDFCLSNSYYQVNGAFTKVNDGLWTRAMSNTLFMDAKYSSYGRNSICVNGFKQHLSVGGGLIVGGGFEITLPTAPNIYPYDTVLTPEQIASGVIKHADSSNSGLIVNGKFDTDTSGWTGANGATLSIDSGMLKIQGATPNYPYAYQIINTVIGKKYKIEGISSSSVNTSVGAYSNNPASGGSSLGISLSVAPNNLYNYIDFTATTTTTYMIIGIESIADNQVAYFDKIAVYPADAISRSDLVFPESYHEDIAEKGFGYPFGNIQYLGGNTDGLTGIANGAFTGFEQYSLFGNWQTPSALIGKGYVWSTLTEAQKRAFIANPENNCYLDGDKTIQVRYRIRVLIGEDSNSMAKATVQGKAVVPSTVLFTAPVTTVDAGLYSNTSATYTYAGTSTNAISIANVGRRNQGMYHNVYNPNGTKVASDGLDCFRTTISFTSTMDCFDPAKLLTASGYIGTVSGRPDGLFYDQVHEGDIQDLRNSSKKSADKSRLISIEFNKLVAGTNRGKEASMELKNYLTSTVNTKAQYTYVFGSCTYVKLNTVPPSGFLQEEYLDDSFTIFIKGNTKWYRAVSASTVNNNIILHPMYGNVTADFTVSNSIDVLFIKKSTRTKSNTLLHCDIIGNPTNYPTSWKQSGVFGTPLIVAEDGTSLLPDGTRDTFKLRRDANATPLLCLRSTDNGATWASFTPVFSATSNTLTLTDEPAGNLVLVYYQTKTSMAVPTVNSEVLELGEVLGTNGLANGALVSTLIGKVATANTAPYSQRGYEVSGYRIDMSTFKFSTTSTELPVHSALSLAGGAIGVPAVKVLPYLTRLNGKAYLNLVFKEMKHNGTSWGDSNTFNIVDNVSTTTDNNAQTVLIGQKTVELPYFIAGDE